MKSLFTERLELRPITLEAVIASLEGRRRTEIEKIVGAELPWTWPSRALVEQVFEASLDAIRADPSTRLWGDRLMVTREDAPKIVGSVVFHGRPDEQGVCEIAYGVEDSNQGKGYATEGLRVVVEWALQQPECRVVRAATTGWHKASMRVLEKVGMVFVGERHSSGTPMRVYEIAKSDG